jgi:ABC-type molybdenum transport system ATPase subunit/photorepair protein PhrA
MILYGDNGSGKTTILSLIVNLLSHVDKKGHKKRVAGIKFRRCMIWVGKYIVEARRDNLDAKGFTACVLDSTSRVVAKASYYTDDDKKDRFQLQHKKLLSALHEIGAGLYFLADNRRLTSNILSDNTESEVVYDFDDHLRQIQLIERELASDRKRKAADQVLDDAVTRVTTWATRSALSASTQGEEDVNTIYSKIITQLATPKRRRQASSDPTLDQLKSVLESQHQRSVEFSQFGLASPPKLDSLLRSVTRASKNTGDAIAKVLGPYVDSMKARLDALQNLQKIISSFVASMNSFYTDKTLTFDLRTGIRIQTREGELLTPGMLSSGERQLLLLFCNTVVAKQSPSIFIIDEPELSLNVKWQRQLVRSLLDITADSQTQFLLATHSIELLTRHKELVLNLVMAQKLHQ